MLSWAKFYFSKILQSLVNFYVSHSLLVKRTLLDKQKKHYKTNICPSELCILFECDIKSHFMMYEAYLKMKSLEAFRERQWNVIQVIVSDIKML